MNGFLVAHPHSMRIGPAGLRCAQPDKASAEECNEAGGRICRAVQQLGVGGLDVLLPVLTLSQLRLCYQGFGTLDRSES